MHADLALGLMGSLFWTGMMVSAPVLLLILLVGLVISVIQVVTQVQELALSFVPKLVATAMCLVAFGPWMLRKLTHYTVQLWSGIPTLF